MHNLKWNLDEALQARFLDGLEEGIEKGGNLKAETVALKLIRRGRPLLEIQEDTGLPLDRIQQLATDNHFIVQKNF